MQMNVAIKQEVIRYYDVTEFQQERDPKRLLVELKNSETRGRAVQKINKTYKLIINQLLQDSLYYQPVLDALNGDWSEQTMLVTQTYGIGFPAIQNAKKLEKELKALEKVCRKEDMERFKVIDKNRQMLKEHSKIVKTLVRRDVSFSLLLLLNKLINSFKFSRITALSVIATIATHDQ
jgi:hypothetical protein